MLRAGRKKLSNIGKDPILAQYQYLVKATCITQFVTIMVLIPLLIALSPHPTKSQEKKELKGHSQIYVSIAYPQVLPASSQPSPTLTPHPTQQEPSNTQVTIPAPKATQIDETTWTVNVKSDSQTGNASEIFNALNAYRTKNGKSPLIWDDKLANYAQNRADLFSAQGATDKHAGFNAYLDGNGFDELGFNSIGENSSYGYHVTGTKLIEEVYASDAPHNDNQLADKWTHGGIGVNGVATDIIFAGNKQ